MLEDCLSQKKFNSSLAELHFSLYCWVLIKHLLSVTNNTAQDRNAQRHRPLSRPCQPLWAPWWVFWNFEVLIEGIIESGGSNNQGLDPVGHSGRIWQAVGCLGGAALQFVSEFPWCH